MPTVYPMPEAGHCPEASTFDFWLEYDDTDLGGDEAEHAMNAYLECWDIVLHEGDKDRQLNVPNEKILWDETALEETTEGWRCKFKLRKRMYGLHKGDGGWGLDP